MISRPDPDWAPDPEMLAAYGDGELDDRPELQRRIEDWLARHAEAQADLEDQRRLRELFLETTAPDPGPDRWQPMLAHLHQARLRPGVPPPQARGGFGRGVAMAAAACVALLIWTAALRLLQPALEADRPEAVSAEVFPVASADEIVVLRIEGDDTQSLVVGRLPLQGPLQLADAGDIETISAEPDAHDQMVPQFRLDGRPMIWARLSTDD